MTQHLKPIRIYWHTYDKDIYCIHAFGNGSKMENALVVVRAMLDMWRNPAIVAIEIREHDRIMHRWNYENDTWEKVI